MNLDIANAWSADLRANSDKQGHGRLFDGKCYCCLGRLVIILGGEFEQLVSGDWKIKGDEGDTINGVYILSHEMRDKAGMKFLDGYIVNEDGEKIDTLTGLNDKKRKTFPEIADVIDKYAELL